MADIKKFIKDQLSVWPLAAQNFRSLKQASYKHFNIGGLEVSVQLNPCRIASSTAEVDEASIAARKCFLCAHNRPKEQFHVKYEGKKRRTYNVQVNPYPVFRDHLVVVRDQHLPQTIWHHFPDMLLFTKMYHDFTVFYNGPMSGASAPDHLHFQACPRGVLPLEIAADKALDTASGELERVQDASLYKFDGFTRGVYILKATTQKSMAKLFYRLLECSPRREGEGEPRFNLYSWYKNGEFRTVVVLRSKLRSHHYSAQGEEHLTMSPGAADMAGFFIAPKQEDFEKITREQLASMVDEVSVSEEDDALVVWRLTRTQPKIDVGIMAAKEIVFEIISDGAGPQRVSWMDGKINYNGMLYDELTFDAVTRSTLFSEPSFILYDIPIGIGFHWEQKITRRFAGRLRFIVEGDFIRAVNRVGMEDYLLSVVSSEMKADAPPEFFKAHAIISRSWLISNLHSHGQFDVCADDHCQRYQGLDNAVGQNVRDAVDLSWGSVLTYGGKICDARYSKCCGGTMELFSTCWEDNDYPYLQALPDVPEEGREPFCSNPGGEVLEQVLNDYDLGTRDFYRWEVRYSRSRLSELVNRRLNAGIGTVRELKPLKRGPGGRISLLEVRGDKGSVTFGKELAIRRALSDTHLKSSAFEVEWEGDTCILHGRGWGHGVGLCQIGAAVMASRGYSCSQILSHYYPGSSITSLKSNENL
ncbi:MAG: DUF4922 domain-containing protein [Bacteroidales bacterium]|nr:DUF4922 domain-containing protein [Bacteroidales bacterium]